jgi:hypothetical protein
MVHRTRHCSLSGACHISRPLGFGAVDRWSLFVFLLHRTDWWHTGHVRCILTLLLWLLTCALFTFLLFNAVDRWHIWRCFVGSPDMSVAHRTVLWIIAERLQRISRAASSRVAWLGHQTLSGAPLPAPLLVFAPNFVEFPNSISVFVYV